MGQFIGPENLDFIVKHSWTWYLIGVVFLQALLIFWAAVVIRRKNAEIKELVLDVLAKAEKNSSADVNIAKLQAEITTKGTMISDLRQQLANTKQLVMDGVAAYFDKKEDVAIPPATQE